MDTGAIADLFAENFAIHGELGASVSIWRGGREILNLAAGWQERERLRAWTASTPVLFWSATKGLAAGCLLHACQENRIGIDRKVFDFWPAFAASEKQEVTIQQLLSHQAGLPCVSSQVSVSDHDSVAAALAGEKPHWLPGSSHGYHPRTFGYLLDELVRRITGGETIQAYWSRVFSKPLGLDIWIGMPAALAGAPATIYAPRTAPAKGDPFYTAFLTRGSLTANAFASPSGLHSPAAMNSLQARMGSYPAFGGIGSAASLAKYYALLASGGSLDGVRYFTPETMHSMTRTLTQGFDLVLRTTTAFSAGFMKDPLDPSGFKERSLFGPSLSAFGQPGAGGSHAFADPENEIAFAYLMNQMEPGILPNQKALKMVATIYKSAD